MLYLKKDKKYGRCVFSSKDIKKNEIVEISELILIKKDKEIKKIHETILNNYVYSYGPKWIAIALGIGSLFNHSKKPNIHYYKKNKKLYFIAKKDIKKNNQLFIDYGYDPI